MVRGDSGSRMRGSRDPFTLHGCGCGMVSFGRVCGRGFVRVVCDCVWGRAGWMSGSAGNRWSAMRGDVGGVGL